MFSVQDVILWPLWEKDVKFVLSSPSRVEAADNLEKMVNCKIKIRVFAYLCVEYNNKIRNSSPVCEKKLKLSLFFTENRVLNNIAWFVYLTADRPISEGVGDGVR